MSSNDPWFFEATPAQSRFFDAVFSGRYRFLAFGGGIRSGKSYVAFMLAQVLCRVFPGSRWAIVRKDLPTLRRNVLPAFEKVRVPGFTGELNQSTWTYECTNGSQIILFTESISEDPELNRWRGLEVNGFFPEEANELSERSFRKMQERAGSWVVPGDGPQPPPLIIATFNPSGGWVKRVWYDPWKSGNLAAQYYFQPATILDNPHIPAAYLDSLKSLPERDYKRFVEGDWTFVSGAFFDELGADTHLCQTPVLQDYWTYWGSYDWGFRHPAVAMAFAQDSDGQKYLLDTLRMHRLTDEQQAAKVATGFPEPCRKLVFAGHDAFAKRQAHAAVLESVSDVFARHHVYMRRANIDRKPGWSVTSGLLSRKQPDGTLGTPELLICDTPGNRWAISVLLEMTPDPTDPDDMLKVDANEDGEGGDDPADALRYGCHSVARSKRPASEALKDDDRARKYDWDAKKFSDLTPDKLAARLLRDDTTRQTPSHRVPRNPR